VSRNHVSQPVVPQSQVSPSVVLLLGVVLVVVGWTLSYSSAVAVVPVPADPSCLIAEAVPGESTPAAVAPSDIATDERPASALLPRNALSDEAVAAYWNLDVATVQRLHVERSLQNEHLVDIPEAKLRRAVWRLEHPKSSFPDKAHEWRALRLRDEHGRIAPDGLVKAIQQREAMLRRLPRGGLIAGLPTGPADRPGIEANNARAGISPGGWTWIGPGNIGGRTRALLIHPTNQNVIYAATVGGGVWRTTNGGATWSALTGFSANLASCTMAMHPANPNTIYVGTGEGFFNLDAIRGAGIFRTLDGGNTWTQLGSTNNSNFHYVNRIAISPNGSTILAATGTSLYRSTDGGNSWTVPTGGVNVRMLDCDFHPTDSNKCICSTSGARVWYSTNGGASWTAATGLNSNTDGFDLRAEVCYARADANIVYASVDRSNGTIYRSTDGGATFTQRGDHSYLGSQGWYDNIIWAGDPTNADRVIVGGIDLFRSTDGGTSLTQISVWSQAPLSAHADHHDIFTPPAYNGTSNQTLLFANDGGVYRGSNVWGEINWQELNNNLGCTQFYGGSANSSGVVYGGTQDNGTLRFTGNTEGWTSPFGGDGGWCASDPTDPNYHYGEYVYLTIHRSTNGGVSASYIYNGITDAGSQANFIAPFILDPSNPNRLLAGGRSLWRSDNVKAATPTWTAIKPSIGSNISAICVHPLNSDLVWVGHNNGDLYYTTNGTSANPAWTKMDGSSLPDRYLERIAVDPTNPNVVYVSFGGFTAGNLWKSTNAGVSWTNISGTLPAAPINGLAVHPTTTNWIYAGTEVGVFASEDGGATWSPTNEGPVNVAVDELFFTGNQLTAVTHGRGMYRIIPASSGGGGGGGVPPAGGVVLFNWNSASRTLTLTGDALNNVLTVTWRGTSVMLTASQETKIQNGSALTTSVTIQTGSAALNITGDLREGNDSLTLVSLPITTLSPKLGNGNDRASLSYCTVNLSRVDGGAGTDTFTTVGTTITSNQNVGFP